DSTGEHFFIINADGDNFKYDNTEYFYYRNSGRGKVLIVNGEPSPDETKNEVFFLSNALKSYFNESLKIYTVLEDMIPETPQLYDIILLANVSILDEYRGRLLSDYVREGGRLLVTLGSRINISAYNRLPFMPADIIRMVDAEKDENIKYFNEGFFSAIPELIQGMKRVKLYRIFEVKERQDSKILIKTSEQRPLLLSGDYGKGFVMLYTTSVDMDMNDFPVRKNYLPFISVVFSKMLDGLSDRRVIYVRGGEEISLKVQDCSNEDMVINGNRHISVKGRCREEPSGGKVLMFNAPFESGFYRLSSDNTSAVLVVNSDKAESVLKRTPFKEMKKGKGIQGGGNSLISKDILKGGKLNLIEFLLALAGIILFSEMFVMNRR
ncbi:MAG: hypothetical protein N3B13_03720, partial [Deltaproteobacteria bacterium]|nr:hypothetical protein [Deltaproteobacteria bacterium]